MTVKKFNISTWSSIKANYWGITKCGNTSVKYALLEKEGKNIHKPEGVSQWVHDEKIIKYISITKALNGTFENFTVIRNPYNRIISMYNDFIKRKKLYLIALGNTAKSINNIDDFLEYLISVPNNNLNEHFKPQTDFILIKNKIVVDHIFDINNIIEINKKYNLNIPHINTTNNKIELNSHQRRIINKLYEKDFKILNYKSYE